MRKKALKILAALLCLILCLAVIACNEGNNTGGNNSGNEGGSNTGGNNSGNEGGSNTGGNNSGNEGGSNEDDIDWDNLGLNGLPLIYNNKARFQVVYTSSGGPMGIRLANEFVKRMRDLGVEIGDAVSDRNAADVKDCEIIIGTGARHRGDEVSINDKYIGPNGYVMKVVGTRIVIAGGSEATTSKAYNYYLQSELGIKSSTKEIKGGSLAVKADFVYEKFTEYGITSITVGGAKGVGNDLRDYVFIQDLSALPENTPLPHVESFHEDLFDASGIWLEFGTMDNADSYEHKFIIRYVADKEDMDYSGFHAYLDGNKDIIIECAYWNDFDETFKTFTKTRIFDLSDDIEIKTLNDKTLVSEVKYSDFGAKSGDGVDDFAAIFAAHEHANQCGQKVVADKNATYNVGPKLPSYPVLLRSYGFSEIEKQHFSILIKTDVDFNGATFIINDEGSDAYATRENSLFMLASNYDPVVINGQTKVRDAFADYTGGDYTKIQIYSEKNNPGKGTTKLPWLVDYVGVSDAPSVVYVENCYHRDYIRHGANQNSGDWRRELYLVHPDGTIDESTLPEFDFLTTRVDNKTGEPIDKYPESADFNMPFTRMDIYRTDDRTVTVENGKFINVCCKTVPDSREPGETENRNRYRAYSRGFLFMRSNVVFKDITHKMKDEPEFKKYNAANPDTFRYLYNFHDKNKTDPFTTSELEKFGGRDESYPYYAFIYTDKTYNLLVQDVQLTGHTTYYEDKPATDSSDGMPDPVAMGTYDMAIERAIAPRFVRVTQVQEQYGDTGLGDRRFWGIMTSNHSRNLYFEGCEINRFDAHMGFWGATIKDTVIGHTINFVGGGTVLLENVEKLDGQVAGFISIRGDYGASFGGDITVRNCKYWGYKEYNSRLGGRFDENTMRSTMTVVEVGGSWDSNGYCDWWFGYDSYMPASVTIDGFSGGNPDAVIYVFNQIQDMAFRQETAATGDEGYSKQPLIKTEKIVFGPNQTKTYPICATGGNTTEINKIPVYKRDKNGKETRV